MSQRPVIRSFEADEWRAYRDLRLRALADSPDAFGSTLGEEEGRPEDEWRGRLAVGIASADHLPLVAELGGEAVGLVWGHIDSSEPERAHLYQMWVAPSARGLGAGRMLLGAVIAWAANADASVLELGVTDGETPARRLYSRAGLLPVGEPEGLRPGSAVMVRTMQLALKDREI